MPVRAKPVAKPAAPKAPAPTSTRPASCPAPAFIDSAIAAYSSWVKAHPGQTTLVGSIGHNISRAGQGEDAEGDRLFNIVNAIPVACLSKAQGQSWLAATGNARAAANQTAAEASKNPLTAPLQGLIGKIGPYLKVGAGGLGVIVSGLALVYVAGRNTGAGKAAGGALNTAAKVAPVATAPARVITKGASRAKGARTRNAAPVGRSKPVKVEKVNLSGTKNRPRTPAPTGNVISLRGASKADRARAQEVIRSGRVVSKGGE